MKRMLVALGVLGFVCAATFANAQEPNPGADLKRLHVWVGDWTWEQTVKDSPSGAERKVTGAGKGERLGDSFYVFRSQFKDADGKETSGVNIMGFDPVTKTYFTRGFDSTGRISNATVKIGDKTATEDFTSITASGEKVRWRCTWGLDEKHNEETCEILTDGKWWVSSKGKYTKVK